jgi:ABC-type multidrug transport system ATPase subunit
MGRNGAGKTTMFRICVGRVRADYGRVLFRGEYVERPTLSKLARRGLFYSSQDSALTRLFTIENHLSAIADTFPVGPMEPVVAQLELGEFLSRRPQEISGGERQRSSLAMALLRRPACLLMDEPFAGVAPADRPIIRRGLRSLSDAGGAVMISGHDVDDIFETADEIIWVTAGTTHYLGAPAQAAGHGQFRREYLGPGRSRLPGGPAPSSPPPQESSSKPDGGGDPGPAGPS